MSPATTVKPTSNQDSLPFQKKKSRSRRSVQALPDPSPRTGSKRQRECLSDWNHAS